ncbi:MAG TPA: M43 family zinc metalloprotease [Saprospiraceae bacterium]|nr:M43 family zinc metalloprotease [Saprospiraceae bacterium]
MKYLLVFLCVLISTTTFSQDVDLRCNTVNYMEKLRQAHPEIGTDADFESWMATEVEKLKKGHKAGRSTYTIPVIFHVIHDGEAVGATPNVSATYINAQIEQLNIDYANLAGSTNSAADDTEIQFCPAAVDEDGNVLTEPGINRRNRTEFGFTAPPWSDTYVDNTIKSATIWDPTQYFNVWVLDISGGLLGWAQFPEAGTLPGIDTGNGGADTDGVVILYSSVGSMAEPFGGGNSAYDNGRTLTHEAGHWLGLRHIWGDGNCNVDDYCNDTPNASAANFGCPNVNSCNDGNPNPPDMVENYMDYTDDDCMDIFTADQADRMHVVMGATGSPSPRRAELNNSTVCSLTPCIALVEIPNAYSEPSHCTDSVVLVGVYLNLANSTSVTVTLGFDPSSTASIPDDISWISNSITFNANETGIKYTSFKIVGDGIVENSEEVVITILSITGGDGSLEACNTSLPSVTILDDDKNIETSITDYYFIDENFDTEPSGWTVIDGGSTSDTWQLSTLYGSNSLNGTNFAFCDSDAAGSGSTTYETMLSPVVNTENATTLTLDFDQYFRVYTGGYKENTQVDVYDGANWINVYTRTQSNGTTGAWSNPNHRTIDLLAYKNAQMQLRFIYDAKWDYYWALDNIQLHGDLDLMAQHEINTSNGYDEEYLGPNQTVYFYDQISGNIMMKIENLSTFDYGCTKVEVDHTGYSYFADNSNQCDVTDKTYLITPTFNTTSGNLQVSIYYDDTELAPWISELTAGCDVLGDLHIVSSDTDIASSSQLSHWSTSNTALPSFNKYSANVQGLLGGIALGDKSSGGYIYVDGNASGINSGNNFLHALNSLHEAIIKVENCPDLDTIIIAKGTYHPTLDFGDNSPSDGADATYRINSEIMLFGGFEGLDGLGEINDFTARNLTTNVTYIDADVDENDGTNTFTDNVKIPVTIGSAAFNARIDGIHIANSHGDSSFGIDASGQCIVENCVIENCIGVTEGAGMRTNSSANITLKNVEFKNNSPKDILGGSGNIEIQENVDLKE